MTEPRSRSLAPLRALAVTLACALLIPTLGFAQDEGGPPPTLAQVAQNTPELSTFAELLEYGSLTADLQQPLRITVLAPSDAAFEALPDDVAATLRRNPGALNYILRNHMFIGAAPTSALRRMDAITTLLPTRLPIRVQDDALRIDGARIVQADLRADNGVLHVIDTVLIPIGATSLKNVLTRPEAR